jgi:hypothetical protein
MNSPAGPLARLTERLQPPLAVSVVGLNGAALIAAPHDTCPAGALAEADGKPRRRIGFAVVCHF